MLDIPGTTSYYFYVVGSKDIQGSLSHIPRQHHVDPHLLQFSCYVRLALPYYFFKEKMEFLGQSPSLAREGKPCGAGTDTEDM